MKELFRLKGDKLIWILVVFFAMVSVLAVFSSSTYRANSLGVEKTAIFFEQLKAVIIGFVALFICYLIPVKWYRAIAFPAFLISVILLVMTFIPHFQVRINGAIRGVKLFGVSFQVFEFAKVGLILYLAKAMEVWDGSLDTFKDFALKLLLPVGLVCVLVMANSFSSALLFGGISFLLMWFMGVRDRFLLITVGIAAAVLLMMFSIYSVAFAGKPAKPADEQGAVEKLFNRFGTVQHRIASFTGEKNEIDEVDLTKEQIQARLDNDRQSENAKIAISQGGIFGKGPGKSTQRYSLSMAFSDFIFAFIVEEYGLIGGIVIILLYTIFLFRCIRISARCNTVFSGAVVTGLSFLIAVQAMLHIFVNVRMAPITGHTLPLISHGGTAYMVLCGAFGIILSVSKKLDKQDAEKEALAAQEAGESRNNITEVEDYD